MGNPRYLCGPDCNPWDQRSRFLGPHGSGDGDLDSDDVQPSEQQVVVWVLFLACAVCQREMMLRCKIGSIGRCRHDAKFHSPRPAIRIPTASLGEPNAEGTAPLLCRDIEAGLCLINGRDPVRRMVWNPSLCKTTKDGGAHVRKGAKGSASA
jgi:hypothetical protein